MRRRVCAKRFSLHEAGGAPTMDEKHRGNERAARRGGVRGDDALPHPAAGCPFAIWENDHETHLQKREAGRPCRGTCGQPAVIGVSGQRSDSSTEHGRPCATRSVRVVSEGLRSLLPGRSSGSGRTFAPRRMRDDKIKCRHRTSPGRGPGWGLDHVFPLDIVGKNECPPGDGCESVIEKVADQAVPRRREILSHAATTIRMTVVSPSTISRPVINANGSRIASRAKPTR